MRAADVRSWGRPETITRHSIKAQAIFPELSVRDFTANKDLLLCRRVLDGAAISDSAPQSAMPPKSAATTRSSCQYWPCDAEWPCHLVFPNASLKYRTMVMVVARKIFFSSKSQSQMMGAGSMNFNPALEFKIRQGEKSMALPTTVRDDALNLSTDLAQAGAVFNDATRLADGGLWSSPADNNNQPAYLGMYTTDLHAVSADIAAMLADPAAMTIGGVAYAPSATDTATLTEIEGQLQQLLSTAPQALGNSHAEVQAQQTVHALQTEFQRSRR